MMAAKLEWKHSFDGEGDKWEAGKWRIRVSEEGTFFVVASGSGRKPTLADAKDWCQAQEDAAAPAELPAVGSVWGVPGNPETWRWVYDTPPDIQHVVAFIFGGHDKVGFTFREWQSWVRESGAVRIDGEGERPADARALCEEMRAKVESSESDAQYCRERFQTVQSEMDKARAETAKLRAAIKAAGFSVMQTSGEWSIHDVSERGKAEEEKSFEVATRNVELEVSLVKAERERDDARTKLAALERQYQSCEDKVATEFERCARLLEALRGIAGRSSERKG